MASTDETFEVHQGHVVFRVPLCVNAPLMKDSGVREIDIIGEIAWQTCDDQVCDIPQKHRFNLTLPVAEAVASELGASNLTNVKTMNAAEHFLANGTSQAVNEGSKHRG